MRFIASFLIILLFPTYSFAHKMNRSVSVIEINDAANRVEITHQLFAHDLEHVFNLTSASLDYFETKKGREALDKYVREKFTLANDKGPILTEYVGTDVEFDVVYVFYEADLVLNKFILKSSLLFENGPSQRNLVNIRYKGITNSFEFGFSDKEKIFDIDKVAW